MKRHLFSMAVLLIACAVLAALFSSAQAAGSVLFTDDFSSDLSAWTAAAGEWGINDGQLSGVGAGGQIDAWIYAGQTTWTDYSLRVTAHLDDGNAEFLLRSTGHWQNEYRVSLWTEGSAYGNAYQISKYQNGSFIAFTDDNEQTPVPITGLCNVRIDVEGNTITLYVNDQLVRSVTDPDPLPSGRFALGVIWSYGARFDDLQIVSLGEQPEKDWIKGRVMDASGNWLGNVAITDDYGNRAITDQDGWYSLYAPGAGSHVVTPALEGYTFGPPTRTVPTSTTGNDFTAFPCVSAQTGLNLCQMQPGDVVLIKYDLPPDSTSETREEYMFIQIGGSYFIHAALYAGMVENPAKAGEWRPAILEAVGNRDDPQDEVVETPLLSTAIWLGNEYLADWSIVRPKATAEQKVSAVEYAREKAAAEGVYYAVCAEPYPMCRDENWHLHLAPADLGSDFAFYCSKMVWKAYQQAGIEIAEKKGLAQFINGGWVTPEDLFWKSKEIQWMKVNGHRISRGAFRIYSPAHLLLTDSAGRRTGYDPATGTLLNEIPGALYSGTDGLLESIHVSSSGRTDGWTLAVNGYDTGSYELEIGAIHPLAAFGVTMGVTQSGMTEEYPGGFENYPLFFPLAGN